jgi:hypothetical protein
MMKRFQAFALLLIFIRIQSFAFEKSELFESIYEGDAQKAIGFFDKIESISYEEAHELITEIHQYYVSHFGSGILDNEEYQKQLNRYRNIYHSILRGYGIHLQNSLIENGKGYSKKIIFCKKDKNSTGLDDEIPGSIVLGGVEILGGALVWILPFPAAKQIGSIMIADGIRRTFNGLEEMDRENKNNQ